MLFLSKTEARQWTALRDEIAAKKLGTHTFNGSVRPNLLPVFHYFIGAFLANSCFEELAKKWFAAGANLERGEALRQ